MTATLYNPRLITFITLGLHPAVNEITGCKKLLQNPNQKKRNEKRKQFKSKFIKSALQINKTGSSRSRKLLGTRKRTNGKQQDKYKNL
jgi:hypothetical protein